MQLRGDLGERAIRIGRELAEATLAAGHMGAQRPHESVCLLDQPPQLGFGDRLVREDFAEPFEEYEIRCLGQGTLSLPDRGPR